MENEYISKDRLREIIKGVNKIYPYKVPGDYDTYSQYNEGWQDACNTIERMIDAEECQQPERNRVLTLKEALKSEDPVWCERNGRIGITELISSEDPRYVEILSIGVYGAKLLKCANYNKTWRCWLRKPTSEEMAKEAWEDDRH